VVLIFGCKIEAVGCAQRAVGRRCCLLLLAAAACCFCLLLLLAAAADALLHA
jgi:hypothetical protein